MSGHTLGYVPLPTGASAIASLYSDYIVDIQLKVGRALYAHGLALAPRAYTLVPLSISHRTVVLCI